jgi:hypothetical protein
MDNQEKPESGLTPCLSTTLETKIHQPDFDGVSH